MIRILGVGGDVVGAGTLIAPDRVLTCAHVVQAATERSGDAAPEGGIDVDFVDAPGTSRVTAHVLPGEWVPPDADGRGDVAVLALDAQQPGRRPAPLRRWPLSGGLDQVRAYGFPPNGTGGGWLIASLIGPGGPGGEWIQLERRAGRAIRPGFSGAAVIDDRRGHVIGMVVGADRDPRSEVSWMIPVETVLAHLPGLAGVTGTPAMDPSLLDCASRSPADRAAARDIAGTISDRSAAGVRIVVVAGSAGAAALGDVLCGIDRESGRAAAPPDAGPDGPVPARGSVDLAVDARGKTPGDVLHRIADRAGLDSVDPHVLTRHLPAMTIVLGWVDEATDPGGVLDRVVDPLVSARADLHFVLVFGSAQSAAMASARSLRERSSQRSSRHSLPPAGPDGSGALDAAAERVRALIEAEREVAPRHSEARRLLAGVPAFVRNGSDLRGRLASAQEDVRAGRRTDVAAATRLAAQAHTARQAAEVIGAAVDRLLAEHAGLRRRLSSDGALAAGHGWAEEPELIVRHREAREALAPPCDLDRAGHAVERHAGVIRRLLKGAG